MSNHSFFQPKLLPVSMPHTLGIVINPRVPDAEEDDEICPVCDGECTCDNTHTHHHPPTSHHASPQPQQSRPTLKIKLTVPQSLLDKRRAIAHPETTSTIENEDDDDSSSSATSSPTTPVKQPPPPPKRRGRPPKLARNSVTHHRATQPSSSTLNRSNQVARRKNVFIREKRAHTRPRPTKDKDAATTAAIKRKVAAKKRRRSGRNETADTRGDGDDDDDDGNESDPFPTFISASALSSLSSSDSDASSSDEFEEADSDIEAEEERFIISQVRDKARTRRELLGDDTFQKRDYQNNWVIRPRKKSVGPSDDEMDVDSEATTEGGQDDEEEEDEEEEEDVEETDDKTFGSGYIGLATGWSEDDESSFDADLFFANLTDSKSSSASSTSDDEDHPDQSDIDSPSVDVTDLLPHLRRGLENLPFEVTESWDGQIVFTNGLHDGQGVLDIDFEIDAAQFMADLSASPSTTSRANSDVDMNIHSDIDDPGYEQDADAGEGDTTDEELVGDDDLPNERAMRLFNFPLGVSAINPLSTVSPGPLNRLSSSLSLSSPSKASHESPKPADILAGRVFWDSDEPEDVDDAGRGLTSLKGFGPRRGSFVPSAGIRNAIIDDAHQELPSPHPNFHLKKGKSDTHHLRLASIVSSSVADQAPPFASSEDNGSAPPPDTPDAKPIELNDVLEASFLDPDPPELPCSSSVASDSDAKNFQRWDHISVGAFRQTRETGTAVTDGVSGWPSDPPTNNSVTDYGKAIKPRPLDGMLWQARHHNPNASRRLPRGRRAMAKMMDISPVILPRDGDQTPTNVQHQPQKSRRELRRERKLKRKSIAPLQHQYPHQKHRHQNPHQQHHQYQHHHYPNMKSRSAASVQRSNLASSSVPPLSL